MFPGRLLPSLLSVRRISVRRTVRGRRAASQRSLRLEVLENRELLAVLSDSPLVGDVTESSAKVFVRTDEAAQVSIDFSTDMNFSSFVSTGMQATAAAADFTRILQIDALQPETKYYYRVLVDGVSQQASEYPSLTTFPVAGDNGTFSFAVVSDVTGPRFAEQPAPVYQRVAAESPAFVLQIGDFDHRNPRRLAVMRQMHREVRGPATAAGADWAQYIAPNFPVYHVYDDHDYGRNNGDKTFPGRADALQAFQEYYPTPELPNPDNGIWHKFTYGQAEFFMLDLRSQRDVNADPDDANKSMLDGDNIPNGQKEWLKQGLANSTADWKFIISTVPFNRTVGALDQDPWVAFGTERQELLDFIAANNITGVSIVSGDLHSGGGIDDGTNSDLAEITVPHTNLLQGDSGNIGTWSEGVLTGDNGNSGYALITVDPAAGEVLFETKGEDGLTRVSYVLSLTPAVPEDQVYYFSTAAPGTVTSSDGATVVFDESDIVQLVVAANGARTFSLYFDGSDVGLSRRGQPTNVDAFDVLPDGSIVVSASSRLRISAVYASPDVGSGSRFRGDRQDLWQFTPTSLGPQTTGSWSLFLDGSATGLNERSEDIDAVAVLDDGTVLISTTGAADANGTLAEDEDLLAFDPVGQTWSLYFDGSDVGLTSGNEDVDALFVDQTGPGNPVLQFSALGPFAVSGAAGQAEDVVRFSPLTLGDATTGIYASTLLLDGSLFGLAGLNLNGFDRGVRLETAVAAAPLIATAPLATKQSAAVINSDATTAAFLVQPVSASSLNPVSTRLDPAAVDQLLAREPTPAADSSGHRTHWRLSRLSVQVGLLGTDRQVQRPGSRPHLVQQARRTRAASS